jgi:hypothetical protein
VPVAGLRVTAVPVARLPAVWLPVAWVAAACLPAGTGVPACTCVAGQGSGMPDGRALPRPNISDQ